MDAVSNAEWSRRMRSTLTLDLPGRAVAPSTVDPVSNVVLSSPDVRLLKLASPELERLVLQQYNYHHLHQHYQQQQQQQQQQHQESSRLSLDLVPADEYARGFVDALLELHAQRQTDADCTTLGPRSSVVKTSATPRSSVFHATTQHHADVSKASTAPHTTSGCSAEHATLSSDTPPVSPVELAQPAVDHNDVDDERARLERKRARNRLAATRCRNRKLERIEQLQTQADRLRAVNAKLIDDVKQLRETVEKLRHEVLLHSDCQLGPVSSPPRTSAVQLGN